jgi:hypothetical protein
LKKPKINKNYEASVPTENRYNTNKLLAQFSKSLFKLDEESRITLSVIAKHGPLNGRKIAEFGENEWSHSFSYEIVKNRMGARNHTPNLIDSGFVIQKEGNQIGHIRRTREKIYFLTLKGFVASLSEIKSGNTKKKVKFEENYLINDYKKLTTAWLGKYDIPTFVVKMMKYNLALFLLKHKIESSDLTGIGNIEAQISSMNKEIFLDHKFPVGGNKLYEKSVYLHTWFRVYTQILNEAFREVLSDLIIKKKRSKGKIIDGGGYLPEVDELPHYVGNLYNKFVRYWHTYIIQNQFQDESRFKPFLIGEKIRRHDRISLNIDNSKVNLIAKQILEKYKIGSKFNLTQEPKFFTD